MDNVERQARYGGGTTADVLKLIKAGRENDGLTPGQRKRKKLKRGGTRRAMNSGTGGLRADPELFILDEAFPPPRVVEVFGQVWELPS
jgi:hypothetical protein